MSVVSVNYQPDDKLPEVVAGLEMLTVENGITSPSSSTKRVLRKRVPKPISNPEVLNRRCNQKPKKRTLSEMENEEDVKVYYLDKSVKKSPHTLETIFEEDEKLTVGASTQPHMSTKRFKRMINFQIKPSDTKQKKRRLKIKKVFGSKIFTTIGRSRRMDMKDVLKKLELIRSSSPVNVDRDEIIARDSSFLQLLKSLTMKENYSGKIPYNET